MGTPVPIPISRGAFKNADTTSIDCADTTKPATVGTATEFKNLILDDAGTNLDRPGLSAFATTGQAFGIIGLKYFGGSNTVIAVDRLRQIWSITQGGGATEITGTALGGSSRPTFDDDGTYLAIAGGGAPQQWNGGGLTALLAGSPPDCSHINYLDGYWITHLLNDQELRLAGPTAPTRAVWNTSDFVQAEGLPDNILAQTVLLRELYAFGVKTTEIFQNFGSSSSPFQRTFFIDRGIGAVHSVVEADNTLWWLDNERRIVKMEGRTPVQISGPIDRIIQNYSRVIDCWATNIQVGGFYFLLFVFPYEDTSWAYDYKRQEWYEWDGFLSGESAEPLFNSHAYVKEWNKNLVGDPSTGSIYTLDFNAKTDSANVLRRLRRFRYKHGTNKRKRSNYYMVSVKRGVGTPGSTEPVLEMRVNDDNRGWSNPKQIPLGFPGESQAAIRVRMGGIYRARELEIQMTDNCEFSLSSIEEDVDPMES